MESFRKKHSIKEVEKDLQLQWILRYGLFESIQIVIDISCHITTKYNLGNPKTYADCIELLEKEKYINNELCKTLLGMTGLRNILIHEYVSIELKKIYLLLNSLDDFRSFANQIKDFI